MTNDSMTNDQTRMTGKCPNPKDGYRTYDRARVDAHSSLGFGAWSFVGHWNLVIGAYLPGPIAILGCLFILGCADTKGPSTRPTSLRERQDAALQDPFNYNPDMPRTGKGGDIGNFDKEGFNQDLKRVFNP